MPSSSLLLCGNYEQTYEVIQGKFRASLEPLWAVKIARYVEYLTHISGEYIIKLPFTLSNKVELFERMQSPGLRNATSTCGYIYSLVL